MTTNGSRAPLFIGGDGRSGTTLLNVVLDSHPELAVGPELHFRGPANLGRYVLDLLDVRERAPDTASWMEVRRDPARYAGVHFINRCHRFGVSPRELRRLVVETLAEGAAPLESFEQRCRLVERIGEQVRGYKGARRWGIKIMREIRIADRYAAVWPDAAFVHIVRDGRDVAASQLKGHPGWGYADIVSAARGWADIVDRVDALAQRRAVTQLRYEDLVTDPRRALAPLLAALEVQWDDRLLQHEQMPHAFFDNDYGHPSAHAVRQPMSAVAVGRYRLDLTAAQIEAFEFAAAPQLRRHGYDLEHAP